MNESQANKMYSAKYAILGVFGLAIAAVVGGMWYRTSLQRRSLAFWGTAQAVLILRAPQVELLALSSVPTATGERLTIAGRDWTITRSRDVSQAQGLQNLRGALLNDFSFDWSASVDLVGGDWKYALRFRDDPKQTTVAFAPAEQIVAMIDGQTAASLTPAMSAIDQIVQSWLTGLK